ncbi:MAG TPA: metallophosphoesterase [Kofleriaceae bacterium]|nr:metallophosphoesterase [Kofleriaceae bacterium]
MLARCSALVTGMLFVGACHEPLQYEVATGPRDWTANPALVSLPSSTVYAVSDIHGGYTRLTALLSRHGLIAAPPSSPEHAQWTGGDVVLVIAGDMLDKGPDGLDVIDLLRALQTSAPATGGQVVVLLGNHEAEFFADPTNSKAEDSNGIDTQLDNDHIDLVTFASGIDPRGLWLRQQAFGARIGAWFFSHAGNTKGRTFDALEAALRTAFDSSDFKGDELIGSDSLLEARDWYGSASAVAADARAMGVEHFVFGHDPGALGARGAIATAQSGALVRIDCGMSPDVNDSAGTLLRIRHDGGSEVAEQLDPVGGVREIWRAP